jgi:hypothetical protein
MIRVHIENYSSKTRDFPEANHWENDHGHLKVLKRWKEGLNDHYTVHLVAEFNTCEWQWVEVINE